MQALEAWNEDVMFDLMHGDEEDEDLNDSLLEGIANGGCDGYDEDDFYQDTARDCDGWEEEMTKKGEFF
jgi:hypothetical protein